MVCHDLPSPSNPLTFRVFNAVKYLSKKYNHNITLVAFKEMRYESRYTYDLEKYCDVEVEEIPNMDSFKMRLMYAIKNMLSFQNIFSKNPSFFNFYYSPKMQRKIRKLLKTKKFDIIFVDLYTMIPYVLDVDIPKIIEVWAEGDAYYREYKSKYWIDLQHPLSTFFSKIYLWFQYYKIINYEKKYEKFDRCVTATDHEKNKLKSYLPNLNISVIPYGADLDYFKPMNIEQDFPSLIFVGNMSTQVNKSAIIYFYTEIYPLIKDEIPNIKLYIVGKDPSEEILKLTSYDVIVTGYVEDVRPYMARASVVILPIIKSVGIKTRVFDVMAMGKPLVSTSIGARGINVLPEENIIIADDPKEFARLVIELLNNDHLRQMISSNARKFIESNYSWEKMTDMLNKIFQNVSC